MIRIAYLPGAVCKGHVRTAVVQVHGSWLQKSLKASEHRAELLAGLLGVKLDILPTESGAT